MAAGAAESESEKGPSDRIDMLLPFLGDGDTDDGRRQLQFFPIAGAQSDKPEGCVVLRSGFREKVVRELTDHKLIVGHIRVKGGDDPVAIEKGRALGLRPLLGNVGIAGKIEPVPSPAFAIVG